MTQILRVCCNRISQKFSKKIWYLCPKGSKSAKWARWGVGAAELRARRNFLIGDDHNIRYGRLLCRYVGANVTLKSIGLSFQDNAFFENCVMSVRPKASNTYPAPADISTFKLQVDCITTVVNCVVDI